MSSYFKRVLSGGLLWGAALTLFACLYAAIGVLSYLGLSYYTRGDVVYFLPLPREDVIHLLLPLIAALPAATLCAEDRSRGYLALVLKRCGNRRYVWRRLSQAVLGAALAVCLGFAAYCAIVYSHSPYTAETDIKEAVSTYLPLMTRHKALPLALDTAFRLAFAAATWALVAAGCSAFMGEMQALLVTVVAYYFLSQLLVGSALNEWMPQRIQMPDLFTTAPLWHYSLRQLVQFLLAALFGGGCLAFALRPRGGMRP